MEIKVITEEQKPPDMNLLVEGRKLGSFHYWDSKWVFNPINLGSRMYIETAYFDESVALVIYEKLKELNNAEI